jgi:hypothetical protein
LEYFPPDSLLMASFFLIMLFKCYLSKRALPYPSSLLSLGPLFISFITINMICNYFIYVLICCFSICVCHYNISFRRAGPELCCSLQHLQCPAL